MASCLAFVVGGCASATTNSASNASSSAATLNASVNPKGLAATVYFEWGTTISYGNTTSTQSLAAGSSPQAVSAQVTGLLPGTTYHYRVVASDTQGTTYGDDLTFTTSPGIVCSQTMNGPGTVAPGTVIAPYLRVIKSQYQNGSCGAIFVATRAADGTLWGTDNNNNVWKSTDDMATWQLVYTASGYDQVENVLTLSTGTVLIVVRDSNGIRHILRSTDSNATSFSAATSLDIPANGYLLGSQSWVETGGAIYVGDTGDASGGPTLWKSTDDGRSFFVAQSFPTEREVHSVEADPYAPGRIWVLLDQENNVNLAKVGYSDDGGQTFTYITTGAYPQSRVVGLMFAPDAVYWGTDSPDVPSELWRWDRSSGNLTRLLSGLNVPFYSGVSYQGMQVQFSGVEPQSEGYIGDEYIHVLTSNGGSSWSATKTPFMRTPGDPSNNTVMTGITVPDAQGRFWVSWWNINGTYARRSNIEFQLDSTATLPGPTASFTAPGSVGTNTPVNFDGSSSSSPAGGLSFAWTFGDGGSATGVTTSHTYASPGNYNAELQVTDANGNSNETQRPITVVSGTG